jgi:hypothetical protein
MNNPAFLKAQRYDNFTVRQRNNGDSWQLNSDVDLSLIQEITDQPAKKHPANGK